MKTKIYVLTEPDGEIRYIGKTSASLKHRLCGHISKARFRATTHKDRWICSVLKKGFLPQVQLLNEVEGDGNREEIAWIAYGRSKGWKLTNQTDGGEGMSNPSKELRFRLSEANKGKTFSFEHRRKLSEARKARKKSIFPNSETRQKMSIAHTAIIFGPETRRKISNALKGNKNAMGYICSSEHRHKISEAKKGHIVSPETRRKISESHKMSAMKVVEI